MDKQRDVNIWIRYLFPVFLALFLGTLIFLMAQFREPPGFTWYALLWFVGVVFLIWESGWWVDKKLARKYSWRTALRRRLVWQLAATNVLGVGFFLGSYLLLNAYEVYIRGSDNALGNLHIAVTVAEAFIIVQMINSVQIGYQLMANWQAMYLEAEAYKKESAAIRLAQLQRAIDPAFLHHNFDQLKTLMQESPEEVNSFLKQLSDTYSGHQSRLLHILANIQQALQQKEIVLSSEPTSLRPAAHKRRFLLRTGNRLFKIDVTDIVLFYKDDIVLAFTHEGKKYPVDLSLEEISLLVDKQHFFRINRQFIIHDRYLSDMRVEGNQMLLNLTVDFPLPLAVSQRNIAGFKRWLDG
jgi:DNA-binding LytR/AlgR family response regulator